MLSTACYAGRTCPRVTVNPVSVGPPDRHSHCQSQKTALRPTSAKQTKSLTAMKSAIHKFDPFVVLFFAGVVCVWLTTSGVAPAQSPWGSPLFPPLERSEAETLEDSSLGTAIASLDGLSVPNEEDALDKFSKSASGFEKMFDPILEDARQSLVKIRSTGASRSRRAKRRQIALGTVVSGKGWVLTKASELKGQLFCETSAGELLEAKILGLSPEYDLALLQVQEQAPEHVWQPARWAGPAAAITGDWLATPLDHKDDAHLGVVSVDSRLIPPAKPFIGIRMINANPTGVEITGVQAKSPASKSGLRVNDVILRLNDAMVKDIEQLREQLEQSDAGDVVTLSVIRNGQQRKVKLALANRDKVSSENMRSNQQNRMGTRLSGRRKNFPLAFQHDTALQANECGGPIVNIEGDVVGVNVARAGRVASLAIPAHQILEIIEQLGSGAYSPEIVNAKRIRAVDREINESKDFAEQLSVQIENLLKSQDDSREVLPGYEAAVEEMVAELDQLRKRIDDQRSELDDSRREVTRIKRLIRDLERERKHLETGVRN